MKSKGDQKEQEALDFLSSQGVRILVTNYRSPYGEIDIISKDISGTEPVLAFIEVRYRQSQQFGGAAHSVTYHKQQKIVKTAQHYLQHHPSSMACRFDVVAIDGAQIQWIKHAFTL